MQPTFLPTLAHSSTPARGCPSRKSRAAWRSGLTSKWGTQHWKADYSGEHRWAATGQNSLLLKPYPPTIPPKFSGGRKCLTESFVGWV
jgi:hypothetical protein